MGSDAHRCYLLQVWVRRPILYVNPYLFSLSKFPSMSIMYIWNNRHILILEFKAYSNTKCSSSIVLTSNGLFLTELVALVSELASTGD